MQFKEALKLMVEQGAKIKLPSWGGYWCWDDDKKTVLMYCRPQDTDEGQGPIIDIRDTQRVLYTLENICSDEWMVADEDNCLVLGGKVIFDFSTALKYLKRGLAMTREDWIDELVESVYIVLGDDKESFLAHIVYKDGTKAIKYYDEMPILDMMEDDWCFANIVKEDE